MNKRPIILLVGSRNHSRLKRVITQKLKNKYNFVLIANNKNKKSLSQELLDDFDAVYFVDFMKVPDVSKVINSIEQQIVLAMTFGEANVLKLQKVVPHLPLCNLASSESLKWATNKILMRKRFHEYNPEITPNFCIAEDSSESTIKKIEKMVPYPLIVKPTNMATSMFVTKCYHRDELQAALVLIFKKSVVSDPEDKKPEVIVEEYMEGKMYSIDGLVNNKGEITLYPLVHVKTGKEVGFDDFFGYQRITPVLVNQDKQKQAQEVTIDAIKALKLKNVPFHIELMRLEDGWKIIEIAPRQGGYRENMYRLAYGVDITHNEVLAKLNKKIVKSPKRAKGYVAVLQIFAKSEGKILKVSGIKKAKSLESCVALKQKKTKGERATFAKNGGKSVFDITLFNKDRSLLLADIRRVEKELIITTK